MKKDERVNLKVNKITRDRLMSLRYCLNKKSIDQLLNELIDDYEVKVIA
jgi:hypothetical protein